MLMLFILSICFQEPEEGWQPEGIHAQMFVEGRAVDLIDVRIKGSQPYVFELRDDDGSELINLFNVSRISREDRNTFRVLFLTGEEKLGTIRLTSFTANPDERTGDLQVYHLHQMDRIHFIQGAQIRACAQGHYEELTPHPFCPVCGNALSMGPYEEIEKKERAVAPIHRLYLDGRDPSSTATRRY